MRLSVKRDRAVPISEQACLAALTQVVPHQVVREVVAAHAPPHRRDRRVPYELTLLLVIAMNLYTIERLEIVLTFLLQGLRVTGRCPRGAGATSSAVSQARARLGVAPVVALFHRLCTPLATTRTPGAWYQGLRLVAMDSCTADVPDTPANDRAFGRPSGRYGRGSFPQVLITLLVECGTHAICDAVVGRRHSSAPAAARRLLRTLRSGTLLLVDSGLCHAALVLRAHAQGVALLGRIGTTPLFQPLQGLPDGSYLTWLYPAAPTRRTRRTPHIPVRIIVYRLSDPARPGQGETHRLLTTLLDHRRYPARDLVLLYHERWEIELVVDELATHLRPATRLLRSKTPGGVRQELYGLFLAHYAVRATIVEAAAPCALDPDRVSFTTVLGLLRVAIPLAPALGPRHRRAHHRLLLADAVRTLLPPRALRWAPRRVKRRDARFRIRDDHYRSHPLPLPFVHAIELTPMGAALLPSGSACPLI